MANTKKSVEKVAEVVAPTTAPAKRVVKKATEKAVEVTPPPVVTPPAPAPVQEASSSTEETTTWQTELASVKLQLTAVRDAVTAGLSALGRLEKRVARELKEANRGRRKSRRESVDGEERKPSVFNIPIPISDELATFLGKPKGTTISRAEVTKAVTAYVKAHSLNNKHSIKADATLQKLLGVSATDELTIFNLQKYLKHHYTKKA